MYKCVICQKQSRHPTEILDRDLCVCSSRCMNVWWKMSTRQQKRLKELVSNPIQKL